jgi:hypothetical protein
MSFKHPKMSQDKDNRTVGSFHIAGGHVIFVIGNGFHLLRSDYISLCEPSLRKETICFENKILQKSSVEDPSHIFRKT